MFQAPRYRFDVPRTQDCCRQTQAGAPWLLSVAYVINLIRQWKEMNAEN